MKKLLVILAIFVLLLTSCVSTRPLDKDKLPSKDEDTTEVPVDGGDNGDETEEISGDSGDVYPTSFSYHFYSCWTNWTDDERVIFGAVNADAVKNDTTGTHLPLYRIDSVEALKKFKEDYAQVFSLGYNDDGAPGFNEKTASKDEAFFEENVIFVAYMNAESGKLKYQIRGVIREGKDLLIEVEQRNDFEEYTDDMPSRLIVVEFLKEEVKSYTAFDAVYVGEFPHYTFEPPPNLTVASPYGEIQAIQSGAHWWGGEVGMIADSDYPYTDDFLDNMNYLPNVEFFGEDTVIGRLSFDFARRPDKVSMSRWRIGDEENRDFKYKIDISVTDDGFTFPLNTTGCYAYSLRATWEKVDNIGGSAQYYFCVGDREGYYDECVLPSLTVSIREHEIKAAVGASIWSYTEEDGTRQAKNYDAAHPVSAYFEGGLPLIPNEDYYYNADELEARLTFDFWRQPDEVTVRRWNTDEVTADNIDTSAQLALTDGKTLNINKRDTYVYEVTAVWNEADGTCGTVTYAFSVGPTPRYA